MKKCLLIVGFVALAGCGGEGSGSAPAAGASGAASQKPATTAAATAAATATATAAAAPAAGAYKGLKEGNAVVGYVKDPSDEAQCGVITVKPEEKDKVTQDELKKIATMIKGELTSTCPTDNIVGGCRAFGISIQYYGPKYTKDTAKKDCKGTWAD